MALSPGVQEIAADPRSSASPDYTSPILMDVDGNDFRLVGVDDGVRFDLAADGVLESLGWTTNRASWRRDRVGNLFRYRSSGRVEAIGTPRRFATYDVFFVIEDDTSESTEP